MTDLPKGYHKKLRLSPKRRMRAHCLDQATCLRHGFVRPLRRSRARFMLRFAAGRSQCRRARISWLRHCTKGRRAERGFKLVFQTRGHANHPLFRADAVARRRNPPVLVGAAGCAAERRPGCGHCTQRTDFNPNEARSRCVWRWACGACRASSRRSPGAFTLECPLQRVFIDVAGGSPPSAHTLPIMHKSNAHCAKPQHQTRNPLQ